jgi:hypothetical protein
VRKHGAEKSAKGFTCWTQFVAMLFCHMARADSLREICNGLASFADKLIHLGVFNAPNKSTLSYANANRPAALFEDLFWAVSNRLRANGGLGRRKKKFRFKNKLLSFDSTTITLCLSLFPWASYRRAKGGVKVHLLLDHDDYMPAYVRITEARPHDRLGAQGLKLNPGSIVAFDRAYNDYELFAKWTRQGVYFVTRMKSDADYTVDEKRPVPQRGNVLSDETIRLSGVGAWEKCPFPLRRIVVWSETKQSEVVLLTNHMTFGSTTIASIYKDRWEIEIFFKTLKQNLKIKTFVGTSENALRIQVWTALIALLLIRWLHHLSHASWSFSNMASLLRMHLFTYCNLLDWLESPFGQPPPSEDDGAGEQLEIPLAGFGQPLKV